MSKYYQNYRAGDELQDQLIRSACLKSTTRQCKTSTSQKSFVSRSTRVWNILPKKLTEKNTTFSSFKSGLYEYYKSALSNYDVEDPRTWKSISLSCNMYRNLSCPILCCC